MKLLYRNSESAQALRAEDVFFSTRANRDATTTGRHASAASGAVVPKARASTLDEMAHKG